MGHKRDRERSALVKPNKTQHIDLSAEEPSAESYVLVGAQAEYTTGPDKRRVRTKLIGRAPADSVLGRSLAAIPLLLLVVGLPTAMGLIGRFLVQDKVLTTILVGLGLFVGVGFAVYLVRYRRTKPSSAPVIAVPVAVQAPEPEPAATLPPKVVDIAPAAIEPPVSEPGTEAGTPS